MNRFFIISTVILALAVAGCSTDKDSLQSNQDSDQGENSQEDQSNEDKNKGEEKVINLEVQETHWMFNDNIMRDAWTYNGTLPGEEIRVQEGDTVILNVKNALDVPTALHLHGFPVPNEMDGVPGVTQNAIMPGEEFTYEYQANIPGTYWYHSHQDSATQVGNGLYGVFIVEPTDQESYDLDETLVIDEISSMEMMNMSEMGHGEMDMDDIDHGNMDDMDHGEMNTDDISHNELMNKMYDTMIINGKASPQIEFIQVEEGNRVKLRFLNAGLFTQVVSIPGHSFKITHYDGQPVNEPDILNDTAFRIAPAERFEVEMQMDNPGAWGIQVFAEENQDKLNVLIPIIYHGFEGEELYTVDEASVFFDFTAYGESQALTIGDVTKEFDMILGTNDGGETFTINDKQFPNHEIYEVEEGDVVKYTIVNETEVDHPMHLHGEFFYVISKDGIPIQGSPVLKDTINVKPGEAYEILVAATNPGNWLFHCHELHHAGGGMVAEIQYKGFTPLFTPESEVSNQPE
ncbi:Multicopper oxidase with three cupredoxin domains (includes cell division protein FtsP and spore coat protein CotA) [Evansella caseinilytica]|uniref:Multicopper oxidase with three cupredoxin domains (Includes cell division protein FtsP and spore coat protein CotA) n=1 Tax=Evansella caseinilytica TaxID=1503961 RepID=A0A1H3SDV5_9BACI|nr:multicopper oxidase family protein [Evansella caseinilytica]SDZ35785.1 Multicopper oxidase with three cupredoxin domains (includes cell division protein FtsP and spore coat protein CotA) [Evansella caseinilytica]